MRLSEKIVDLRKRSGLSQEELGDKLGISRQSVSKWESDVSIPDIDKIVKLSELFGVSTDYLLKEEEDTASAAVMEPDACDTCETPGGKSVSMDEARCFLNTMRQTAGKLALGVSLCILSPICLLILGGLTEMPGAALSEKMAGGVGVAVLLCLVAAAVALFIAYGMRLSRFEYLDGEIISLEGGVERYVLEQREEYEPRYRRAITLGVVLCIVGVIPLMLCLAAESEFAIVLSVCLILVFCAVGVNLIVCSSCVNGSYQKLLQEGDYTPKKKEIDKRISVWSGVYWCIVTAIYLAISFYYDNWERSWIIWPVAAVLFAPVYGIAAAVAKNRK